jgi:hypothetical protein
MYTRIESRRRTVLENKQKLIEKKFSKDLAADISNDKKDMMLLEASANELDM